MNETELKHGAVIEMFRGQVPVKIRVAIKRTDSSWFVVWQADGASPSAQFSAAEIKVMRLITPAPEPEIKAVRDGRLTIPLYHGTNSAWYPSIKEFGLGGRNVIAELKVIELLQELVTIAEDAGVDEVPGFSLHSARSIANQFVGTPGWNYRHGTVYLSAAAMKAAAYCSTKRYGSEAFEYCLTWYEQIRKVTPDRLAKIKTQILPFLTVAEQVGVPLVLEIKDVPVSLLRSESGGEAKETLDELECLLNDGDGDLRIMGQCVHFESVGVIPAECITAYSLGPRYTLYAKDVDMVRFEPNRAHRDATSQ